MSSRQQGADEISRAWRNRWFWLVAIGPLVVVVAGVSTAVIAYHGADRPLDTHEHAHAPASVTDAYGHPGAHTTTDALAPAPSN